MLRLLTSRKRYWGTRFGALLATADSPARTKATLSGLRLVRNLYRAKPQTAPMAVTWLFVTGGLGPLGCGLALAAKRCLADILNGRGSLLIRASFYVEGTLGYG